MSVARSGRYFPKEKISCRHTVEAMDRQPWIYPWIIAYAIYALAILSTVQLAGAVYVLSTGIIDILCVWELTVGIVSVRKHQDFLDALALSLIYKYCSPS